MNEVWGLINGLEVNTREREITLRKLKRALLESKKSNALNGTVVNSFNHLRKLRNELKEILATATELCSEKSNECLDIKTLLEFNALVSLEKEENVLTKVINFSRKDKHEIFKSIIGELETDLKDVISLRNAVLKFTK